MSATYEVVHHAYCGMSIPLGDGYTYAEAKARMRSRIKWFKDTMQGQVAYLRGTSLNEVEFLEPDNCMMVPDCCGVAVIRKEKNAQNA